MRSSLPPRLSGGSWCDSGFEPFIQQPCLVRNRPSAKAHQPLRTQVSFSGSRVACVNRRPPLLRGRVRRAIRFRDLARGFRGFTVPPSAARPSSKWGLVVIAHRAPWTSERVHGSRAFPAHHRVHLGTPLLFRRDTGTTPAKYPTLEDPLQPLTGAGRFCPVVALKDLPASTAQLLHPLIGRGLDTPTDVQEHRHLRDI